MWGSGPGPEQVKLTAAVLLGWLIDKQKQRQSDPRALPCLARVQEEDGRRQQAAEQATIPYEYRLFGQNEKFGGPEGVKY